MLKPIILILAAFVSKTAADIVFENEEVKLDEIFDLDYARASNVSTSDDVTTLYYCTFRSNWNAINHPALYPELARWGNPILFSHSKQYAPFIKKRAANAGVELIAEVRCDFSNLPVLEILLTNAISFGRFSERNIATILRRKFSGW
jgi:Spondin_N